MYYILDLKLSPIPYPLSFLDPYTASDISKLTLYTFILVSGSVGNALVIRSFIQVPDQPGTKFVIGLAITDVVASILIPFHNIVLLIYQNKHWPLGNVGCLLTIPWIDSLTIASAWLLVAISLERAR